MTRQPGQYGDRYFLSEHKLCEQCHEPESRLDARFCCWCGAAFTEIIYTQPSYATKTILVKTTRVFPPTPEDRTA